MPRVKTRSGKIFFAQSAVYRNGGVSCTVGGRRFFYPGATILRSAGTGTAARRRRNYRRRY